MGIVKGFFRTVFSQLDVKQSDDGVKIEVSLERFGKKLMMRKMLLMHRCGLT